jgi:hypothetical protein
MKESELIATLKAESEANKLEYRREWKRKIKINEIDEEEEQLDFQSKESEVNEILSQNESEDGDEVGSWYGFSQDEEEDKERDEEKNEEKNEEDEEENEEEEKEDIKRDANPRIIILLL